MDRAVIIAGGAGTRLWPWTSLRRPKPLLPLGGGGRSLLGATLDRLAAAVDLDALVVQAASGIGERLIAADGRLSRKNLRTEPSPRDTGPAIALAMGRLLGEDPEAVVGVFPADQRVEREGPFRQALEEAVGAARAGHLVTLGVPPAGPSSRFGYIETGPLPEGAKGPARPVQRFVEKPSVSEATDFLAAGNFWWNSGIFVWRVDRFWSRLHEHAPVLAEAVSAFIREGDAAAWERAPKTSIDYALIEHAEDVAMVPLDAGWNDIGGWDAVLELVREGDAGGAVRLELLGPAPEPTAVLRVDGGGGQAVVLEDRPLLVVIGPEGVLTCPMEALDRFKPYIPD